MAKFRGEIGYAKQLEVRPGIWQEQIVERMYVGDVLKNVNKWREGKNTNDDLTVENRFSVVSDSFADENFHLMRYVHWMGARWKITSVEVQRPRLVLLIGGVYNGPTASTPAGP